MQDKQLNIGDHIIFVDEHRVRHDALVTQVWENMSGSDEPPGCNLVYVIGDERREDQYGRQTEHRTSVVHKDNQAAPGWMWHWPDEG